MLSGEDLHNLEALVGLAAISRCNGKRRAAEEEEMSVETLNKQIRELEKNLGLKLVDTKGKNCVLTSSGKLVVNNMLEAEDVWKQFRLEKENRHLISGHVKVGVDISVAPSLVPETIAEFFEHYPALGLEMISLLDVEKDSVDCDICITREPICKNNDFVVIFKRKLQCGYFASSQYLANHGYPVDLADMAANHRLVVRRNAQVYDDDFQQVLKESTNVNMVSSNSSAIVDLVRSGAGIGILPLKFKDEGLVCFDNLVCNTPAMFYLMSRIRIKDVPRVRLVLEYYKEMLAEIK